jgi:hypothetical protein
MTLLSISVIAKMLNVSPTTIRSWIIVGRPIYGKVEYLHGFQAGTMWRVSESELQRFLSSIQTSPRARRVNIGGGGIAQTRQGEGSAILAKALQAGRKRPATPTPKTPLLTVSMQDPVQSP